MLITQQRLLSCWGIYLLQYQWWTEFPCFIVKNMNIWSLCVRTLLNMKHFHWGRPAKNWQFKSLWMEKLHRVTRRLNNKRPTPSSSTPRLQESSANSWVQWRNTCKNCILKFIEQKSILLPETFIIDMSVYLSPRWMTPLRKMKMGILLWGQLCLMFIFKINFLP